MLRKHLGRKKEKLSADWVSMALKILPLNSVALATRVWRHASRCDPAAVSLIGGKPRGWAGEIVSCAAGNQEEHRLTTLTGKFTCICSSGTVVLLTGNRRICFAWLGDSFKPAWIVAAGAVRGNQWCAAAQSLFGADWMGSVTAL